MSLFSKIGSIGANIVTGGAYSANKGASNALNQTNALNEEAKKRRLALVDQRADPQTVAETSARLKYLNSQADNYSHPLDLSQDAEFQGQRAQLVSDGVQKAAGVDNQQRATGIRGGTSNMGSVQDQYDRLNGQLASLAGDQAKYRTQQADQYNQQAADLSQGLADRSAAETNARLALKDAIESGDVDAATKALQTYQTLKSQATSSGYLGLQNLLGQTIGGAAKAGATGGAVK